MVAYAAESRDRPAAAMDGQKKNSQESDTEALSKQHTWAGGGLGWRLVTHATRLLFHKPSIIYDAAHGLLQVGKHDDR